MNEHFGREQYDRYRNRNMADVALEKDWEKVIRKTKPRKPVDQSLDVQIDLWIQWLSSWYTRVMPDGKIRKEVFLRCVRNLGRITTRSNLALPFTLKSTELLEHASHVPH
ncbi:MAG TPA: hypothetical protein VH437_18235 [Terriglobales bacterium]|jgi:hypothetical protein